jgi:hypothetical protein
VDDVRELGFALIEAGRPDPPGGVEDERRDDDPGAAQVVAVERDQQRGADEEGEADLDHRRRDRQ